MVDPFAAALEAQFNAPGSAAAVYLSSSAMPVPIRVIFGQADQSVSFGGGRIVQASHQLLLLRRQVPDPAEGDTVFVDAALDGYRITGGRQFRFIGDAVGDLEGLMWTVGADPL